LSLLLFWIDGLSSSDTETDDNLDPSNRNHPYAQINKSNQPISNNHVNPLVVQTITDEEKLQTIKQNAQKPSYQATSSPSIREFPSTSSLQKGGSSEDGDSLFDQSTIYTDRTSSPSIYRDTNDQYKERMLSIPKSTKSLSTIQSESEYTNNSFTNNNYTYKADDCASVTSSEWGLDSERDDTSTLPRSNASKKRKLNKKKDKKIVFESKFF